MLVLLLWFKRGGKEHDRARWAMQGVRVGVAVKEIKQASSAQISLGTARGRQKIYFHRSSKAIYTTTRLCRVYFFILKNRDSNSLVTKNQTAHPHRYNDNPLYNYSVV